MTCPYNPFLEKPGQLRIGLKPLELSTWIEFDDHWLPELRLKAELLNAERDRVFVSLPNSDAMQQEVLDLVLAHLAQYEPDRYRRTEDCVTCSVTAESWRLSEFGDRPLELASRLVQEDFCVLAAHAGAYQLVAGCVCCPSRWDLRSKLGKSVFAIHDPVPHYADTLGNPVDQLFAKLRVDAPGWRLNWSLADTPDLFLPADRPVHYAGITAENAGDRLWIRVERQNLRRLPRTQAILFTIRTYTQSLGAAVADPQTRNGFRQAIAHLSPQTRRYKSIEPIRTIVLAYLERSPQSKSGNLSFNPLK